MLIPADRRHRLLHQQGTTNRRKLQAVQNKRRSVESAFRISNDVNRGASAAQHYSE
jgi:hypothetical protein